MVAVDQVFESLIQNSQHTRKIHTCALTCIIQQFGIWRHLLESETAAQGRVMETVLAMPKFVVSRDFAHGP